MEKANLAALIFITILLAPSYAVFQEPNVQATSSGDDWPMFLHDPAHLGVTTSTGPPRPVKLWSYPRQVTNPLGLEPSMVLEVQ
jgi:hypothetical protein